MSCSGRPRRWSRQPHAPSRSAQCTAPTPEWSPGPSVCSGATRIFRPHSPTRSVHQPQLVRSLDARSPLQRRSGPPARAANSRPQSRSAAKRTFDVPRPRSRRVAGRERPLAHVVDGRPLRRRFVLAGLVGRLCGRVRVGRIFAHGEVSLRLPDRSRNGASVPRHGRRAPARRAEVATTRNLRPPRTRSGVRCPYAGRTRSTTLTPCSRTPRRCAGSSGVSPARCTQGTLDSLSASAATPIS